MSRIVSINDIAYVRSGYTFRRAASELDTDGLLGLQIGDIRHTTVIEPSQLSAIEWDSEGYPPILKPGDVVLAAKGTYNRAALLQDKSAQVVPSNQFLVLSVCRNGLISPAFLCWLLNYGETQKRLAEYQTGTNISSISKKALLSLDLELPDRKTQEKILRLNTLWEEERRLTDALIANRETMLHGMFQRLLSGAMK